MPRKPALYAEKSSGSMAEAKDVGLWQERIRLAKRNQDTWSDETGAARFEDEYEGKFDLNLMGLKGKIKVPPINEVFAFVQTDIALTSFKDPYITVTPKKGGTVKGAAIWEAVLNHDWRELAVKEEIDLEIIDKDLVGLAWHKVGNAVESEGTGDQLKIVSEKLYSMRVEWRDLVWNLGSRRPPKDCRWMAQRITQPIEDMKKKYPAAAKLEGVRNPDIDDKGYRDAENKEDAQVGIKWEIWDARGKQILCIAEGLSDKWLAPPRPWPEHLDEFPFLMYWDYACPKKGRPMSAIAPWEAQVLEKMVILAQAVNHVKRWNRQLMVKKGAIDPNSLDKFERGDDGAILENTGTGDLEKTVKFMDFGQMPVDFYLLMDRIDQIRTAVSGQPTFEQGGSTKTTTRTLGELEYMKAGSGGRSDRKVDRLETHMENIARHMMAERQASFDMEETIQVTGETPEAVIEAFKDNFDPITGTLKFKPVEITGEYASEVKAGSTLPPNKETRMAVLDKILDTVAMVVKDGPMSPFLNQLIQEILRDFEVKGLEEAYKKEQEQARAAQADAQKVQDVETAKTAMEAEKRKAQADQIDAETAVLEENLTLPPDLRPAPVNGKEPVPA